MISRTHPFANDSADGNWLNTRIQLAVGGFSGLIDGQLRANELETFRIELAKLYRTLSGQATLSTLEDWLTLEIVGDGKGHLSFHGEIMDEPGIGNTFKFRLELDQSFVSKTINDLEQVTKAFPVLGLA